MKSAVDNLIKIAAYFEHEIELNELFSFAHDSEEKEEDTDSNHIGSSFESFLEEMGIKDEVESYAEKELNDSSDIIVTADKKKPGIATKTNPALWARCKSEAKAKMGGKHSARAMQLAVKLYKQRGGGFRGKKPTARTNKMKKWTKQKWMYLSDYKKKKKKKDSHKIEDGLVLYDHNEAKGRYLPEAKWKSLSPSEREATDKKKKIEGKKKQYVANTEKAKVKSKAKYY